MRRLAYVLLLMGAVMGAQGDTLTLSNGQTVKGQFMGFAERKFEFKTANGALISEYPVNVKAILPEAPLPVSVELSNKAYPEVEFRAFDEYTLHLTQEEKAIDERVILLKKLTITRPPEPVVSSVPPPEPEEVAPSSAGSEEATVSRGEVRE